MDAPRYDPQIDTPPLSDDELQALDALLQALPTDNAMNVENLDGYLTALVAGPPRLLRQMATSDWLPVVWGGSTDDDADHSGGDPAPFASRKHRKRATLLVLRHLHAVDVQLRAAPQQWEPVFSVAEAADGDLVDAEDWCIGFLRGVALNPDDWSPLFDDGALREALRPLVLLGGDDSGFGADDLAALADPVQRDRLSRAVADAVPLLMSRATAAGQQGDRTPEQEP